MPRRKQLASALVATIVSFLILEIFVRFLNLAPDYKFYPGPFVPDAALGYVMRPNYQGTQGSIPIATNRLGYRGLQRDPNTSRTNVLVLGDSLAFGWGVRLEEAFPSLVQPWDAFNASVPGYSPWHYQKMARILAPRLHARAVVVTLAPNDVMDIAAVANPQGTLSMYGTENLRNRFTEAVFNNPFLSRHLCLYRFIKNTARDILYKSAYKATDSYKTDENVWAGCFAHLREMRGWCASQHIPMGVLVLMEAPAPERLLKKYGIPFRSVLGLSQRQFQLPGDPHPNQAGHRAIAAEMQKLLEELI